MKPGARIFESVPHRHKDVPLVQNHYVDAIASSDGKSLGLLPGTVKPVPRYSDQSPVGMIPAFSTIRMTQR